MNLERRTPQIHISYEDIVAVEKMHIHTYTSQRKCLDSMCYEILEISYVKNHTTHIWSFLENITHSRDAKIPVKWFMQMISGGDHPGRTSVQIFPNDPCGSQWSFIHMFICSHAKRYSSTFIIIVDHQPLRWKVHTIVEDEVETTNLHSPVICLEGFHILYWPHRLLVVDHRNCLK